MITIDLEPAEIIAAGRVSKTWKTMMEGGEVITHNYLTHFEEENPTATSLVDLGSFKQAGRRRLMQMTGRARGKFVFEGLPKLRTLSDFDALNMSLTASILVFLLGNWPSEDVGIVHLGNAWMESHRPVVREVYDFLPEDDTIYAIRHSEKLVAGMMTLRK